MKRLNVPKEYEHLFDGSKLFCDFTDEEKKVYKEKMMQQKKPFYEKYRWLPLVISILALVRSFLK